MNQKAKKKREKEEGKEEEEEEKKGFKITLSSCVYLVIRTNPFSRFNLTNTIGRSLIYLLHHDQEENPCGIFGITLKIFLLKLNRRYLL